MRECNKIIEHNTINSLKANTHHLVARRWLSPQFKNYQIQWGRNKKEALKIALEQDCMKETRCILVSIKRVRQSLVDLILEHNKKVKELKGESNE